MLLYRSKGDKDGMYGKRELIRTISSMNENVPMTEAREIVDAVLKALYALIAEGEGVKLNGFGIFSVVDRPERRCKHPQTGDWITLPPSRSIRFKPSKSLKDTVNES